jgi:large subunit ribosomal protein L10
MTSSKEPRPEKKSVVQEIKAHLEDSLFIILTDYRGMDVVKTDDLRNRLQPHEARYHVVKNNLLRQAARQVSQEGIEPGIDGPTALICGRGDVVEVAKTLKAFVKENDLPVIKIGSMQGVVLSPEDIEQLAGLPPRPVLLSMLVGTVAAPMSQLVGVMQQKVLSLLYVLKAVEEKKQAA